MAVMGMAVAVTATWEGPWPGRCKGMWDGAGRCAGDARGCAGEGTDSGATAELPWKSSVGIRGCSY
jgi:hypothetical protein